MNIEQDNMTINQYFIKVKNLCQEIIQLEEKTKIDDGTKKISILNGLRLEYSLFIVTIQGQATQPSIGIKKFIEKSRNVSKEVHQSFHQ